MDNTNEISVSSFCKHYGLPHATRKHILSMPARKLPEWVILRGRRRSIDVSKLPVVRDGM
jgi:hypothetical protein